MREAVMSGMVLADDSLINLFPDPAWDVAGFRDLAGGVIAVCLYAAVAMVIVGVLTLLPGLITNNMMERAFSWKRLLCALMIPLTIGAATSGFAWGAGAFGTDGLAVNDSYQSANGHPGHHSLPHHKPPRPDNTGPRIHHAPARPTADNGPEKKGKAPRPGRGHGAVKESGPPAHGKKEKKNHAPAGPGTP